jgi:hypothetical protein
MGSFDAEVHTSHKPRRARVRARALRSTRERSKLENVRVRNLGTRLADSVARVVGSSLAMFGLALALTAASLALGSIFPVRAGDDLKVHPVPVVLAGVERPVGGDAVDG